MSYNFKPIINETTIKVQDSITENTVLVLKGQTDFVYSVMFNFDGTQIVTASGDKTAKIYDFASSSVIMLLKGHTKAVVNATFSNDGLKVVTASYD
mmetsp:Transcript_29451/g.24801  ORF Transcript_29451/g.24801 Transcript_29451/m.24801 type:complete len:96 (-) Transcript_29451:685-972(-)